MTTIRSARLDLVELTEDALQLTLDRDLNALADLLGAEAGQEWADLVPARENLKAIHDDAAVRPWLSRGIVLREAGILVGEVGFHDSPDELGVVELGYEVLPEFRRRGIAMEAIRALTDWAFATGRASTVYATIAHDNAASIGLVQSLGLTFQETYHDSVDGQLVFYERALPLPR